MLEPGVSGSGDATPSAASLNEVTEKADLSNLDDLSGMKYGFARISF